MIQGRYPAEEDIQSEKLQSMISLIRDGYHKDTYKQIEQLGCNLDSNLQHDYVRSVLQVNAQVCFSNYITTCIPKGDEHVTALVNDGIKYREQNAKKHT